MKKLVISLALALAAVSSAQAQNMAPANAFVTKPVRGFLGAGLTYGGDKLATAHYTNGGNIDLHAGALIALVGGVDWTVTPEFSFQASVGYHVDQATGSNGEIRFQRFPFELLAYYKVSPQWRVGGGVRYLTGTKFTSSGAAYMGDYKFDNSVSAVLEGEYMMSPQIGIKLRYVAEKLDSKFDSHKIDANHAGVFANFYF